MRLGKIHFRDNVTKNNMTGATLARFLEKHTRPVETVFVQGGVIIWMICPAFEDLDDSCKKIPEYKVIFTKSDKVLGLRVTGIEDGAGRLILEDNEVAELTHPIITQKPIITAIKDTDETG